MINKLIIIRLMTTHKTLRYPIIAPFTVSHVRFPASLLVSVFRFRLPWNALQYVPSGMLPPEADLRHRTSGNGSPPTRHWNTTELPATTVWSWGPRIRNGFTVKIFTTIKRDPNSPNRVSDIGTPSTYRELAERQQWIRAHLLYSLPHTDNDRRLIGEHLVWPDCHRPRSGYWK